MLGTHQQFSQKQYNPVYKPSAYHSFSADYTTFKYLGVTFKDHL